MSEPMTYHQIASRLRTRRTGNAPLDREDCKLLQAAARMVDILGVAAEMVYGGEPTFPAELGCDFLRDLSALIQRDEVDGSGKERDDV